MSCRRGREKERWEAVSCMCLCREEKVRDGKFGRGGKNMLENLGLVLTMWSETPFQPCISSSKFWGVG